MYCIGDQVIYGIHGVCRIVAEDCRTVDRKHLNYLVLEPEGQAGARYLVPTHNAAAMGKLRKILTAEEMEALLCLRLSDETAAPVHTAAPLRS